MNTTQNKEIIFTGNIPQCPHCNIPTRRQVINEVMTTLMYYPPIYNEQGENTNPDRNITCYSYHCSNCNNNYSISGNDINGYEYGK